MIKVNVLTPEGGQVFDSDVDGVTIPTQMGMRTVLPNAAPFVELLAPGIVTFIVPAEVLISDVFISGGVVHFHDNQCFLTSHIVNEIGKVNLFEVEQEIRTLEQECEDDEDPDLLEHLDVLRCKLETLTEHQKRS